MVSELFRFIEDEDVKFIRLNFCDPFGKQKNISIMPTELEDAINNGISFDASSIQGFADVTSSDLLLFPDVNTLSILPWRPNSGRVVRLYCDIKNTDGTYFVNDGRYILKNTISDMKKQGFDVKIGTECEFYLFKLDEDGVPTKKPLDNGSYLDTAPLDGGENIRREICLGLEELGLEPQTSHHEYGPGQNEIDFKFTNLLESAENFLIFKSLVKAIASRNGLFASFLPKPLEENHGSGLHINISLYKDGKNLFENFSEAPNKKAESFIAGIMDKIEEITLFLNPIANSYKRLGTGRAPKNISWSHQNRSELITIPYAKGDKSRIEFRQTDGAINPYIAFSLIIKAGLYGIENNLELEKSAKCIEDKKLKQIPTSMEKAISCAKKSKFATEVLGKEFVKTFIELKEQELKNSNKTKDKEQYENERYFLEI